MRGKGGEPTSLGEKHALREARVYSLISVRSDMICDRSWILVSGVHRSRSHFWKMSWQ